MNYAQDIKRIKEYGFCIQIETPVGAVRTTKRMAIEYVQSCAERGKKLKFNYECINGRRFLVQISHPAEVTA